MSVWSRATIQSSLRRARRKRRRTFGPARAIRGAGLVLAFLLLFSGEAWADYYDGLRAYDSGDYVAAAEEWYLSASRGDVESQFRLAQLYEKGLGTPQNYLEAHRWYNVAASLGHAKAREARDELATHFTSEQLAQSQRLAAQTKVRVEEAAVAPLPLARFDGHWNIGARLHYSSPKTRCGFQVIDLRIADGQVKGSLRIGSAHFRDAAAGIYAFAGSIDRQGKLRADGHGVIVTGAVSEDTATVSGTWDAFGVSCAGTYEGTKVW